MSTNGANVDEIRDRLVCPSCGYSLRGLLGEEVTCPECGLRINITTLVTAEWTRPWFKAPLFNLLALPLALIVFGSIALLALGIVENSLARRAWPFSFLLGGPVILLAWACCLIHVARRFGSSEGAWLSLLLHLLFILALGGVWAALGAVLLLFADGVDAGALPGCSGVLIVGIGAIIASRFGQHFIARRCIRRYLRIAAPGASMSPHVRR